MPGSYIPVSPKGGVFLEFSRNCFCNLQPHCFTIKAPEAMLLQWVGLNFKDNFGSWFVGQFMGGSCGEGKKHRSHKTYEQQFMAWEWRCMLPCVWNNLSTWYVVHLRLKGRLFHPCLKVMGPMLQNTHSLFPWSLTSFSSLSGFTEVSRCLTHPCLEIQTTAETNGSYCGSYIWPSTELYTNIKTHFSPPHWTWDSGKTLMDWMGMGICHAREEQEYSRNRVLFVKKLFSVNMFLITANCWHNHPRWEGGRATLQYNHFLSN